MEDEVLKQIFGIIAPGKPLRNAIDRIQEASLGALIILCEPKEINDLMEGGFSLFTDFTPQKLYELAKMDGAVLVSRDVTKIYGANLQLQPDHTLFTDESGTRHRTAHRMAMQTGNIVITISERRNKVTIYKDKFKYSLDSIGDLLIKASLAIMSLEKYSSIINKYLISMNHLEYENLVTLEDVVRVIRFFILLFNMENKINQYILELGTESKTIQLQHTEIMLGHKNNFLNLIKDYSNSKDKPEKIFEKVLKLDKPELTNDEYIVQLLGYNTKEWMLEDTLSAKGYRLLSNIMNLTKKDTENIIEKFGNIRGIFAASTTELEEVKNLSKNKAYKVARICEKYKNKKELEIL